jgi:sterol 3beta-glucosyltransferase
VLDPNEVAEAISEALELAGQRGIIVEGWSAVTQTAHWSRAVLCVPEAPYDWLFPQASCVIHHGGTGTIGAVLRAGKVSVVLPQLKCQELYSWFLGRNGLVTGFFEITNLDPSRLAEAIDQAVNNEEFQRNARAWQKVVTADPGVTGAVDLIEEHWNTLQAR